MTLRTIQQFRKDEGLTQYQADTLIRNGQLEYVLIGSRKLIPDGAWQRYLEQHTVKSCPEETKAPDYAGSTNVVATTSSGLKMVAAGSAARARQIAQSLKSHSQNSSITDNENPGRASLQRS